MIRNRQHPASYPLHGSNVEIKDVMTEKKLLDVTSEILLRRRDNQILCIRTQKLETDKTNFGCFF